MTPVTDDQMARLIRQRSAWPAGEYQSPAMRAKWDGRVLVLLPTGEPLNAALQRAAPQLARAATGLPATPPMPTIAALLTGYAAATADQPAVAPEAVFRARLATCRACDLWTETAREGRGSCASIRARCANRLPWHAPDTCPEARWG